MCFETELFSLKVTMHKRLTSRYTVDQLVKCYIIRTVNWSAVTTTAEKFLVVVTSEGSCQESDHNGVDDTPLPTVVW